MKKLIVIIGILLIQSPFSYSQCDEYKEGIRDILDYSNDAYNFGITAYHFGSKVQATENFDSAKIYIDSLKAYLEKTYLAADDGKTSAFNAKTAAYGCECTDGETVARRFEQDCGDAAFFAKKAKKLSVKARKAIEIKALKDKIRDTKKLILKSYNISFNVKTDAEKNVNECD